MLQVLIGAARRWPKAEKAPKDFGAAQQRERSPVHRRPPFTGVEQSPQWTLALEPGPTSEPRFAVGFGESPRTSVGAAVEVQITECKGFITAEKRVSDLDAQRALEVASLGRGGEQTPGRGESRPPIRPP